MVSLPQHFLSSLWPVVNQFLGFGSTLLYGIDQVGYLTGNLSVPLTNLTKILAHDVNPQAIKADLIKVCDIVWVDYGVVCCHEVQARKLTLNALPAEDGFAAQQDILMHDMAAYKGNMRA